MKLKDYSIDDLEQMTYSEITEIILNEKGTKMKIVDIFKKICEVLSLNDTIFENKIADFFELVTTDSRFIILDKGYCDLRKKHAPKIEINDDEDDEIEEIDSDDIIENDETIDEEENDEDIYYDSSSEEDDVDDLDDDLDDFNIIETEDEEANGLV